MWGLLQSWTKRWYTRSLALTKHHFGADGEAANFNSLTVLEILLELPSDLTTSNYVRIDFGGVYHGCPIGMLEDKVFDTTGVY